MRKRQLLYWLIGSMLLFTTACMQASSGVTNEKTELTVSAAASLTDVMNELVTVFKAEHATIAVRLNLGSSGVLQQQIDQGAPTDIFISAAENKFTYLLEKNLIDEEHSINIIENSLVLITNKDANPLIASFADLLEPNVEKVAIGTPESVPAGAYAKQTLEELDLYQQLSDLKKFIPAKDVRQVLHYVETNNVDAGIVYKTDAIQSKLVKIVAVADKENHDRIIYPAGIVKNTTNQDEANLFYAFLISDQAATIFENYGFNPVGSEPD